VSRESARYRLHLVGVKRLGGTSGELDEYRFTPLFLEKKIKMEMILYTREMYHHFKRLQVVGDRMP